jgi:endonuclease/exonuclease/phosphatase family metal-dependent hydrolase
LPLVVRSWNVFHGRTFPESRTTYLEEMIRRVTAGRPDVVALQEVPLWALGRLGEWSGMQVRAARAMPALYGPLGRVVSTVNPIRFRSNATGQANALLVDRGLRIVGQRFAILNPELGALDRLLRWRQRRVCHAVDLDDAGGRVTFANLHTDADEAQIARALALVADAERCVICGDFNVTAHAVAGFSPPLGGIDQILVRGLRLVGPPRRWDDERRLVDGRLLSDHAPIEAVIA